MYIPAHAVTVMAAQLNPQVRTLMNNFIQWKIMEYRYLSMYNILKKIDENLNIVWKRIILIISGTNQRNTQAH